MLYTYQTNQWRVWGPYRGDSACIQLQGGVTLIDSVQTLITKVKAIILGQSSDQDPPAWQFGQDKFKGKLLLHYSYSYSSTFWVRSEKCP